MRKGLVAGLSGVVDELREAMAKRFYLAGPRDRKRVTAARRGPRRNTGVGTWLQAAAHGIEMPKLELPDPEEDRPVWWPGRPCGGLVVLVNSGSVAVGSAGVAAVCPCGAPRPRPWRSNLVVALFLNDSTGCRSATWRMVRSRGVIGRLRRMDVFWPWRPSFSCLGHVASRRRHAAGAALRAYSASDVALLSGGSVHFCRPLPERAWPLVGSDGRPRTARGA